jgi:glycosyltransferase involved in cell wall biosynthesis
VAKIKLNVLITAPSLELTRNISGISSVVKIIMENDYQVEFKHFQIGSEDSKSKISIYNVVKKILFTYINFWRVLSHSEVDLIHLNVPLNSKAVFRDCIIFIISKIHNKPILLHLHGGEFLFKKPRSFFLGAVLRKMLMSADAIITLSVLEREMISKLYKVPNAKVLPNSIQNSYIDLNREDVNSDEIEILFLGRMVESKGIKIILESIRILTDNGYPNLKFNFCGTGPLDHLIKDLEKVLPNNVIHNGVVNGISKIDVLSKASIFILPSIYGEGLPIALLEAMACGIVPIVTADGSMQDVVKNLQTGLIVEKNNSKDLAKGLEFLIRNTKIREEMSINCRRFLKENYNLDNYINELNEVYAFLVTKKIRNVMESDQVYISENEG